MGWGGSAILLAVSAGLALGWRAGSEDDSLGVLARQPGEKRHDPAASLHPRAAFQRGGIGLLRARRPRSVWVGTLVARGRGSDEPEGGRGCGNCARPGAGSLAHALLALGTSRSLAVGAIPAAHPRCPHGRGRASQHGGWGGQQRAMGKQSKT